ncbi:MAG: hypothetical protein JO112_10810, partial [Planctomycetes bacterium]|nr:hypothetical protein [Planctomycetota bacterium]
YSQVSGVLPLDALPRLDTGPGMAPLGVVRCQLENSVSGRVQLVLNSARGLTLWKDGVPVEVHDQVLLDLAPGQHILTFAVELSQRQEGLRCEVSEVPGSSARVQIVSGK